MRGERDWFKREAGLIGVSAYHLPTAVPEAEEPDEALFSHL